MDDVGALAPIPREHVNRDIFGRETLEAIVPNRASILEGSLNPSVLMSQVMPSADRLALARMNDEGLNSRILQNSASVYMGLCEHFRRMEQLRREKAADDEEKANLLKKLADLEETLRAATEGVDRRVEAAKGKGRAESEKVTGEAAQATDVVAEKAKNEAVALVERSAVDAFSASGWEVEDREEWVFSVVHKKIDAWVESPSKMWLAERGDSYYQGGEFFTQRLIYRRLA
ncbi:unnamed protein product [Cuscuta europaea]|uniref:Uncharacterized protein n=1 Tax=Cuscuta europaea TaxID=41803 RepID=A0A9P0ZNC1_CUSEU|nr:unnamed protein product [Cuscuta europaea]